MSATDPEPGRYTSTQSYTQPAGLSTTTKFLIWTLVFAFLLLLGASIPSPYVIERPGPVVNTLGDVEIDGKVRPVIDISGAQTFAHEGALNLLTVTIVGNQDKPLSWLALVPTLFDHTQELRPIEEVFGDGRSVEEREESNKILMDSSQATATAAALTNLDIKFDSEVLVGAVIADSPSENVLQEGDRLLRINGDLVTGSSMLRAIIVDYEPEKEVELTVVRAGTERNISIAPVRQEGQTSAEIGVLLQTSYEFPFEVDIALERIGGPSAGMMFALGIYEELTEESLTGGLIVSGTGTVNDAGEVGAIGGLTQKIWGAQQAGSELFIMPLANCASLPQNLPKNMQISPVANTTEAIAAIGAVGEGKTPPGIDRCDLDVAQEQSVR